MSTAENFETLFANYLRQDAAASWQPVLFDLSQDSQKSAFMDLLAGNNRVFAVHDTLRLQVKGLIETRRPEKEHEDSQVEAWTDEFFADKDPITYGTWVFFPWSGRVVHVLPEAEYRELRTSRNRNKITAEEQDKLRGLKLGVVGLSVGQASAVTLALEEIGCEYRLADFDELELSNMNRLRAGAHSIGVNKTKITAREIFEINPYATVKIFEDGITEGNIDAFLTGDGKLDLLFEECDDLQMKIRIRESARALEIPVLMETSDRGLLDVERFDLEPNRDILHGLIGDLKSEELVGLSTYEKVPIVLRIIGAHTMSSRMAASLVDIETSLKTWPQLASGVALGSALNTDAARRIALGTFSKSGRYFVDLEGIVGDEADGSVDDKGPMGNVEMVDEALHTTSLELSKNQGEVTEKDIRTLVQAACLAPSGGNVQPWVFENDGGKIHGIHDIERSKSFLDFQNTASYLAFGAAVENFDLAAKAMGIKTSLELFPKADDPLHICTLGLEQGGATSSDDHRLAEQIPLRVSNRKLGKRQPLTDEERQRLHAAVDERGGTLILLESDDGLSDMADMLGRGDRVRMLHKTMHQEMMGEIRWSAKEVTDTRDGLDAATLELTPTDLAAMRLISTWSIMETLGKMGAGRGLEKPSRKAIKASSAVGLVVFPGSSNQSFFEGGRAMQRVWLRATELGLAFQPMTAILYLFSRMARGDGEGLAAKELKELQKLRGIFERHFPAMGDNAEIMLFRLAKAGEPSARSLRRPLEEMYKVR